MINRNIIKKKGGDAFIPCVCCGNEVNVGKVTDKQLNDYFVRGNYAAKAFPQLSFELVEMFISGTCPECWKVMFGTDND